MQQSSFRIVFVSMNPLDAPKLFQNGTLLLRSIRFLFTIVSGLSLAPASNGASKYFWRNDIHNKGTQLMSSVGH